LAQATVLAILCALQPGFAQFKPALPGYHYEFPRDYFNHPDYQTEWWYYTGNMQTAEGRKFGFELTFFRQGVNREAEKSSWDVHDLYLAHFAISDLDGKRFFHSERMNRSGPVIAGADASLQKVWNGNWSVSFKNGTENLTALTDDLAINLSLRPEKPPVIHGRNGVSQKSAEEGRASHYFSETRLKTSGEMQIAAKRYEVTGLAWMDHEYFTEQLDSDQVGWDWFSLQLDDNTELMLFRIRNKNGSIGPFSAGTFIDATGHAVPLRVGDFQLEAAARNESGTFWTSPTTHTTYPMRWKIIVPSLGVVLEASTSLPSQELPSQLAFVPSYWEGAISLAGRKNSLPLRGCGYLEMTGYDHTVP
jgi:predicted secreted hydrolase